MVAITGARALTIFIIIILLISSLIYLGITGYEAHSLKNSIGLKHKSLMLYRREGLKSLESKKTRLGKQLTATENSYTEISGVLSSKPKSRMPSEAGDPLKFKEELYKAQTKLKGDGSSIDFKFPPDLGFSIYERQIPTPSELPLRVKQLELIQEICGLALKSKIPEITAIQFEDVKDISPEGSGVIVYKKFPLKISFKCENENLINLLYGLSVSDMPFMVDFLNLKASDEKPEERGKLQVELVISSAVFP